MDVPFQKKADRRIETMAGGASRLKMRRQDCPVQEQEQEQERQRQE
jgi:hypothetical protein